MRQKLLDIFSHSILVLIAAIVLSMFLLINDPRDVFTLEETELYTNHSVYSPGDKILLRFKYCSSKDMNIRVEFVLKDGIRLDGEVKVLPVYEGCGVIWLQAFDVPIVAHTEEYRIYGDLYFKANLLKQEQLEVVSKPFQVNEQPGYLINEFDIFTPLF